jgi:hypothetical protein
MTENQRAPWKKMTEVTYICRSPQNKAVTCFFFFSFPPLDFLSRFWAFRNKESSKTRKKAKSSGLITKNVAFFLFSSVVLLDFI